MFDTWILLSTLLLGTFILYWDIFTTVNYILSYISVNLNLSKTLPTGARAFMIHNTQHSLCLEDSAATGEVLLKTCNLDRESQQWLWINEAMLMCTASYRCLSAVQRAPLQTEDCLEPIMDATWLMWDCDRNRLISRNTSMLLSVDSGRLILTHDNKQSKWRSLNEGDICQEKLSKSVKVTGFPSSCMYLFKMFSHR